MQIQWTTGAKNNLKHIENYIAKENPSAAIDMVLNIIKSVEAISDFPAIGRVGRLLDTRELIISDTPYIVPYRIIAGRIQILRVLHTAMQWPEEMHT